MFGISSSGKDAIIQAVEKMFDILSHNLLGDIPKLRENKMLMFQVKPRTTLAHLFLQSMNNKEPNHFEKDVLKSILNSSHGYLESLKSKTSSNVVEAVDALVKEAKANGDWVTPDQISAVFREQMAKTGSHLKLIAEAEATKTRNMGATMDIVTVSKDAGIADPNVFFIIVRDGKACNECVRLHMCEDGVTPRVWKMSELSMGYHKRGESRPSACGEHPHCRCTLSVLSPGYGFKNGFISFISLKHDEYNEQHGISNIY